MKLRVAVAISFILLAGCKPDAAPQQQEATELGTVSTPAESTPSSEINQPLAPENVGAALSLIGSPRYREADDALVFDVEVKNTGQSSLVSAGSKPVQLGVTLAGPEGVDKAPGKRDFVRAKLPLTKPGGTAQVTVEIPAEAALGLQVQVELVQEDVAWFGRRYGHPTLEVGTFQRCVDEPSTLCNTSGERVAPAE